MLNAGLDEAQAGIKIGGRNINNLRYVDDAILMTESEEELKSLLMKVKEGSEKAGLKLIIQQNNIMASGKITTQTAMVSSAYLRLLIFVLAILIPACESSSLAFLTMHSA